MVRYLSIDNKYPKIDFTRKCSFTIQVRIDENVRMLAELHARWEREDEMA
jgi:hypothetical protein